MDYIKQLDKQPLKSMLLKRRNSTTITICILMFSWPSALVFSGLDTCTSEAPMARQSGCANPHARKLVQLDDDAPVRERNVEMSQKERGAVKSLASRLLHGPCYPYRHGLLLMRVRGGMGMGMYDIDDNDPRLKRLLENQVMNSSCMIVCFFFCDWMVFMRM